MGGKNILILFDGPHVAFSPTTIQLYDELIKQNNVTIIAQNPNNFNGQSLNNRNVLYHEYYSVKGRHYYLILFQILLLFSKDVKTFKASGFNYKDYFFKFLFLKKAIKKNKYDRVLCIDIVNLYFCSLLDIYVDFVSLELCKDEKLLDAVNRKIINCVMVQSKERYEYLFKREVYPVFYIQNAPNYNDIVPKSKRNGLIYTGTANDAFCFYHFLNYLSVYEDEHLTVKGAILEGERKRIVAEYSGLLDTKRLIISNEYLENDEVVAFLSNYEIGFCFYNFENESVKNNYFNYITAPSGKLFKYLAAGVPVIVNNIIGFKFVEEFDCGVLLDDLKPESIRLALNKVRTNYDSYVQNTLKAAQHFSFDKALKPYLTFID